MKFFPAIALFISRVVRKLVQRDICQLFKRIKVVIWATKAVFYTSNYNRKNHPNLLHTSKSYNNDGLVGFSKNGISGVVGSKRPNYEYIYDLFPIRKRKLNILWRCGVCSKTQIWVWASFLYWLPTCRPLGQRRQACLIMLDSMPH